MSLYSRLLHSTTHRLGILSPQTTNILCISLMDIIDKLIEKENS